MSLFPSDVPDPQTDGRPASVTLDLNFPVPLAEKYRPRTVGDFLGLEKPKKVLTAFCQRPAPCAWLFVGPPGVGKSTMALAMVDMLYAELHHIPSQQCNLATVDEVVRACHRVPWNLFGPHAGKPSRFHVVLADEADSMSNAAQLSFLSKLDATAFPPDTIFIFTCNSTDGLEPRFLSRCRVLQFSSYAMRESLALFLQKVWTLETGKEDGPDFVRLAKDSANNVRDALMRLEIAILAA